MRIGDQEADRLYDRLIRPTVARLGLTTRRIDQVMHNERIDQKIVEEIEAADIVVADLTFARPSVYWEAGRAEGRGTPVVYTCRRDHLKPRAEDEFGNYRVHFDVQTTNIVPWNSSTDATFQANLERRLRHVLRPLLRDRAQDERRALEVQQFEALSLAERRQRVADIAINIGRAVGLRGLMSGATLKDFLLDPAWAVMHEYGTLLSHESPKTAQEIRVFAIPRLTKKILRAAQRDLTQGIMEHRRSQDAATAGKAIVEHVVAVSFGPVPRTLVSETLANFARSSRVRWPSWSAKLSSHRVSEPTGKPIRRIGMVHVLGNVGSERQVREALRTVLTAIVEDARTSTGKKPQIRL